MALSNIAGFPRIGPHRELKFATEGHWRGDVLARGPAGDRQADPLDNWRLMQRGGGRPDPLERLLPLRPRARHDRPGRSGARALPATPGGPVDTDTYFAMARGRQEEGIDVTAMEMTKWFDTNYHYIVPELGPDTTFSLSSSQAVRRARRGHGGARRRHRARDLSGRSRSCCLAKPADGVPGRLRPARPDRAAPRRLRRDPRAPRRAGRQLGAARRAVLRRGPRRARARRAATRVRGAGEGPRAHADLRQDLLRPRRRRLRRAPRPARRGHRARPPSRPPERRADRQRTAGLEDQCAVRRDRRRAQRVDQRARAQPRPARRAPRPLRASSSSRPRARCCTRRSTSMPSRPPTPRRRAALLDGVREAEGRRGGRARQGLGEGREAIAAELDANDRALETVASSHRTRNPRGPRARRRLSPRTTRAASSPFEVRREAQRARLGLPLFPTTTIGSYPQTAEIRQARKELREAASRPRPSTSGACARRSSA